MTSPTDVLTGPAPSATPLPADRPVRWGILATGKIAASFCTDLALVEGAELAAVGSRSAAGARAFADEHGVARAHGSYEDLLADDEVDVVYVASPHGLHHEHVLAALGAGRPVLCEKALTLNLREAREVVTAARERGLFLMEAMWMACHPLMKVLRAKAARGELGRIRQVHADLGFRVERPPTDRLLDPALGGGVLLDMGVYPLTFAHLFLGEPEQLVAVADLADSGIDLDVAVSARYAGGAVASLSSSMTGWAPRVATVITDEGRLDLPPGFHHPSHATWTPYRAPSDRPDLGRDPGEPERLEPPAGEPVIGTGLGNEAVEVMRCLRAGETESPLVPHAQTLSLMGQMDTIRSQVGVRYASD